MQYFATPAKAKVAPRPVVQSKQHASSTLAVAAIATTSEVLGQATGTAHFVPPVAQHVQTASPAYLERLLTSPTRILEYLFLSISMFVSILLIFSARSRPNASHMELLGGALLLLALVITLLIFTMAATPIPFVAQAGAALASISFLMLHFVRVVR